MAKDSVKMQYFVDGENFAAAGEASEQTKMRLKQLGIDSATIRRVAICMYEGEINMVIHAGGGIANVEVFEDKIEIQLIDGGRGIPDVKLAMKEGYTTAPDTIRNLGFGAGMGLPNMKKYSDKIKIESEVGKGTSVYMMIKLNPQKN